MFLSLQFHLPGGSDDHLLRAQAEQRLHYHQIKELAPVIFMVAHEGDAVAWTIQPSLAAGLAGLVGARGEPVVGALLLGLEECNLHVGVEITANIEPTSRELGLLRAGSDQGT